MAIAQAMNQVTLDIAQVREASGAAAPCSANVCGKGFVVCQRAAKFDPSGCHCAHVTALQAEIGRIAKDLRKLIRDQYEQQGSRDGKPRLQRFAKYVTAQNARHVIPPAT